MMKESVGGLMDAAPPPDVVARIKELVSTHAAGAIEAHDLRTSGSKSIHIPTRPASRIENPSALDLMASIEIGNRVSSHRRIKRFGVSALVFEQRPH
jgi:divalent metal cation (Fe/Co/Zn/Cd) transporter